MFLLAPRIEAKLGEVVVVVDDDDDDLAGLIL